MDMLGGVEVGGGAEGCVGDGMRWGVGGGGGLGVGR